MYPRHLTAPVEEALADTPVVLLVGARQVGKTTLVQSLIGERYPARSVTLDDATVLAAVRADPAGFLAASSGPLAIDEVQRAPDLFSVIKAVVDRHRAPGRFLLTGSTNVLTLPKLSESLAGRMEVLTLWPLAQSEIAGSEGNAVDALFAPQFPVTDLPGVERAELIRRLLAGGYPEPLGRPSEVRRRAWFSSYLTTILQRDVRDLSNIEGLTDIPRLLALLAARTASLLNVADVSRSVGMPNTTLHRYLALLEATFLIRPLPAWHANLGLRLVKAPKLLLNDTGLIAGLLALNAQRLEQDGNLLGQLLENFVGMELRKHAGWGAVRPELFHFRTQANQEVDVVLEEPGGRLVGVEVKASATVTSSEFKGLRSLAEAVGNRFVRGVVFYSGAQIVPFGADLYAVPLSFLWSQGGADKQPVPAPIDEDMDESDPFADELP
jgi:predicted AAA+ superfamily ATPase